LTDASAPVDLARLNELTEGDPEFAYELASTFIASGEEVVQEIRTAMSCFDRGGLSRAAHKLKGASANIHADPLRALADTLERQSAQLDQPRLKDLVAQLVEEFCRATRFLKEQSPLPEKKVG
jgi:HPt (histidine-containing phosphotransfer) domain-containing protein